MKEYFDKYLISDVAKLFDISSGLVRHYEKVGLLEPLKDEESNYRKYNIHLIEQISNILLFRSLDMPLEDICYIKDHYADDTNQLVKSLENHIDKMKEEKKLLQQRIKRAENYKKQFKKIEPYINKIVIKDSPSFSFVKQDDLLNTKELAKNYFNVTRKSLKLPKYAFKMNIEKMDMNHNLETDELAACIEQIGICVEDLKDANAYGKCYESMPCIYAIYIGTIVDLEIKYKEIIAWIKENNIEIEGFAFELGLLCIGDKYLIEIYVPIKSE